MSWWHWSRQQNKIIPRCSCPYITKRNKWSIKILRSLDGIKNEKGGVGPYSFFGLIFGKKKLSILIWQGYCRVKFLLKNLFWKFYL